LRSFAEVRPIAPAVGKEQCVERGARARVMEMHRHKIVIDDLDPRRQQDPCPDVLSTPKTVQKLRKALHAKAKAEAG
jgi:hypothetical protein